MEPTPPHRARRDQKAVGYLRPGIIDIISELFRCSIINAKGLFVREGRRVRQDAHGMGRFVLAEPEESETGREISINEVDIDNFIRAKGAIFSAIETLLNAVDMSVDAIDHVYVGRRHRLRHQHEERREHRNVPGCGPESSPSATPPLTGAYAMVMSDAAIETCQKVAANMTYLELSTHPGYMDAFVAACFLPIPTPSCSPTASRSEPMQVENHKEEVPFEHYVEKFRALTPENVAERLPDVPFDGQASP